MADGAVAEDALGVSEEEVRVVYGEKVLEDELIRKPLLQKLLLLGSREIFSSGYVEDKRQSFTFILIF